MHEMEISDILDIDEALKDDSFICLEEKTHDDVSNIIQQWKSNNCPLSSQGQQELAYKLNSRTFTRPRRKSPQNLETQFMTATYVNCPQTPSQVRTHEMLAPTHQTHPIMNPEIGGLVTTMHKSFLQDTSPPLSICSSMEVSTDRMNNSLITSADFSNINFLQSSQSIDFNDPFNNQAFNLANKTTNDGYTLSDMIRDRKALESLTLSGDGTLIKDSHIAQIDDISLALSKTASGYSTMDNSTESMEGNNRVTTVLVDSKKLINASGNALNDKCAILDKTILLSEEVIGDTTFELVESSLHNKTLDVVTCLPNETFKTSWPMDETVCLPTSTNKTFDYMQLSPDNMQHFKAGSNFLESTPRVVGIAENKCKIISSATKQRDDVDISPIVGSKKELQATRVLNETFGQELSNNTPLKPNNITYSEVLPHLENMELIDNIENPSETLQHFVAPNKFLESTPRVVGIAEDKCKIISSATKQIDDVNISPIVGSKKELQAARVLNETFGQKPSNNTPLKPNNRTYSEVLPHLENMELIDNIENPNETFRTTRGTNEQRLQQSAADIQMQNVLDLAHAEEELLASNDDQEFEDMLNKFSKVGLNSDHLKMKDSIETIKRRFNRDTSGCNEMCSDESQYPKDSAGSSNHLIYSAPSEMCWRLSSSSSPTVNCTGGGSSTGERLLSRRSRLYDNVNISALSTNSQSRSVGTSFSVQKEEMLGDVEASKTNETERKINTTRNEQKIQQEDNVGKSDEVLQMENLQINTQSLKSNTDQSLYKLAEKRARDRDRFKTMKIVKERNANENVNVPCIDNHNDSKLNGNHEGGDVGKESGDIVYDGGAEEAVSNRNKAEINGGSGAIQKTTKINPKFLTYKIPKDKQSTPNNLSDIMPPGNEASSATSGVRKEQTASSNEANVRERSRSRPRYLSGLQKISVVKATSAGDLERATTSNPKKSSSQATLNTCKEQTFITKVPKYGQRAQPLKISNVELKSPLGTKSKSFHNLATNFGFSSTTGGASGLPVPRPLSSGIKRPTTQSSDAITTATKTEGSLESHLQTNNGSKQCPEKSAFKVPSLVSGIRAPGTKRAGLVRPSSGYYSLNLMAKGAAAQQAGDFDSDGGRQSPTDSMSSASSRGSLHSGGTGTNNVSGPVIANANSNGSAPTGTMKPLVPSKMTKIATGATGIPKPSGLRPPTNVKRSGLPKLSANVVRR